MKTQRLYSKSAQIARWAWRIRCVYTILGIASGVCICIGGFRYCIGATSPEITRIGTVGIVLAVIALLGILLDETLSTLSDRLFDRAYYCERRKDESR